MPVCVDIDPNGFIVVAENTGECIYQLIDSSESLFTYDMFVTLIPVVALLYSITFIFSLSRKFLFNER